MSTIKISFTYGGNHTNKFGDGKPRVVEVPVTDEKNTDVKISDIKETLSKSRKSAKEGGSKTPYPKQFLQITYNKQELKDTENLSKYFSESQRKEALRNAKKAIKLEWVMRIPIKIINTDGQTLKKLNPLDVCNLMTYLEKAVQNVTGSSSSKFEFQLKNGQRFDEVGGGITIWKSIGKKIDNWDNFNKGLELVVDSADENTRRADDEQNFYVRFKKLGDPRSASNVVKKFRKAKGIGALKSAISPTLGSDKITLFYKKKALKDGILMERIPYKDLNKASQESTPLEITYSINEWKILIQESNSCLKIKIERYNTQFLDPLFEKLKQELPDADCELKNNNILQTKYPVTKENTQKIINHDHA